VKIGHMMVEICVLTLTEAKYTDLPLVMGKSDLNRFARPNRIELHRRIEVEIRCCVVL